VSGYSPASSTSPTQAATDLAVTQPTTCPTGKSVLGGGYVIGTTAADSNKVIATQSFPSSPSVWQVHAEVVAGATMTGSWTLTTYANCATTL